MKNRIFLIKLIIIIGILISFSWVLAWWDDGTPGHPGGTGTEPLVNTFDSNYFSNPPTPPIGPQEDYTKWEWRGTPTPNSIGNPSDDLNYPGGIHGINSSRIEWRNEQQYGFLDSAYFENVGCNGLTTTPDTATYDPLLAGDWQCYDYVRFHMYLNGNENGCYTTAMHRASVVDAQGITFTSLAIPFICQVNAAWMFTHAISINEMANYYDEEKNAYFDVSQIAGFIINAPETDYASWIDHGEFDPYLVAYYDWLTLSAKLDPNEPAEISAVDVTMDGAIPQGILVSYNASAGGGDAPITGYHIYRAQGGETEPYYPIDVISSTITSYYDVDIPRDEEDYCYKVLATDGGPGVLFNSGSAQTNTVNASYNEARLSDATPVCVYFPERPTFTYTISPTPDETLTTPTPTFTPTPIPQDADILARLYPNPFNPNMGSKKFYTDLVPVGAKIFIYAMDGSLVEDGEIKYDGQRFEWDGKNKNGSQVVSGLYYLVIKPPEGSDAETKVHRIIVCYKCDTTYQP